MWINTVSDMRSFLTDWKLIQEGTWPRNKPRPIYSYGSLMGFGTINLSFLDASLFAAIHVAAQLKLRGKLEETTALRIVETYRMVRASVQLLSAAFMKSEGGMMDALATAGLSVEVAQKVIIQHGLTIKAAKNLSEFLRYKLSMFANPKQTMTFAMEAYQTTLAPLMGLRYMDEDELKENEGLYLSMMLNLFDEKFVGTEKLFLVALEGIMNGDFLNEEVDYEHLLMESQNGKNSTGNFAILR